MIEHDEAERVRLDKWLWAARFYKTRALASEAIAGGKVQVNGDRAKRARPLQVGDEIRVRQGVYEYQVTVRALSAHRDRRARPLGSIRRPRRAGPPGRRWHCSSRLCTPPSSPNAAGRPRRTAGTSTG